MVKLMPMNTTSNLKKVCDEKTFDKKLKIKTVIYTGYHDLLDTGYNELLPLGFVFIMRQVT